MSKKKNIAVLLFGAKNIEGGGGAERFWADISQMFESDSFNLMFFVDKITYESLKNVNRLKNKSKIILNSDFPVDQKKLKIYLLKTYYKIISNRIKLVHIGFYNPQYYKLFKFLSLLPKLLRPKLSITIVSCFTPYCFIDEKYEKIYNMKYRYQDLFNNVNLNGVLSWYEKFKEVSEEKQIIKSNPYIYPVKYCFTDLASYKPSPKKDNVVIFASRITGIKRPFLFIEVVNKIRNISPEIFKLWEFQMYGDGDLLVDVQKKVLKEGLSDFIKFKKSSDLSKVFPKTKLFISTQELENFTSLSMLEAMACENAIISFDVGQTNYFVDHCYNGFLVTDNNANEFAKRIIEFIKLPVEKQESMLKMSREIAINRHNKENFSSELDSYFSHIL
tara:strand:+ start:991 stop:2157 length:1167 start_codon:yes stop_codon:yes gene_type:complete